MLVALGWFFARRRTPSRETKRTVYHDRDTDAYPEVTVVSKGNNVHSGHASYQNGSPLPPAPAAELDHRNHRTSNIGYGQSAELHG